MTIVVEDGTYPVGANSYVTDVEFLAYAAARGIVLPAGAPAREILLIKAMDYLESLGPMYMGTRTLNIGQLLQWPRSGVYFDHLLYDDVTIPPELKKVQTIIAVAAQTIELFPIAAGVARMATRQTVGPITVEYSASGAAQSLRPIITEANALLNILFGYAGQLRVIRA